MAGLSNNDIARGTGYEIAKGAQNTNFNTLPQRIAVLAEMNTANQAVSLTPTLITSRQQQAALYGWGSPSDIMGRIAFPQSGGGAGSIPVWYYPQVAAGSSAANSQSITVTGTATAAVTHTLIICGRRFLEGGSYDINIAVSDTPTLVAAKIAAAITAVLGCPVAATSTAGVVTTVANWTGLTSQGITIRVDTNGKPAGLAYAIAEVTAGTGTPSVATALATFDPNWITIVVDSYGILSTATNTLCVASNGNADNKTGRWDPLICQPGIYIAGSVVDSNAASADTVITDALKNEMTLAVAPAPASLGLAMEAAMNEAILFANVSDASPNTDVQGIPYPDMPGPPAGTQPQQTSSYSLRNTLVGLGMSTSIFKDGVYTTQDFVTTYHPIGQPQPSWRYPRDLMIDMNIRYMFGNLQTSLILNKQIARDNDQVTASNVVKPKDIKAALVQFANDLVAQGFTQDAQFMIDSIVVVINPSNKNGFNISFSYNRSGVVRVVSNVATAY